MFLDCDGYEGSSNPVVSSEDFGGGVGVVVVADCVGNYLGFYACFVVESSVVVVVERGVEATIAQKDIFTDCSDDF